ncbi:hypothetical protein CY34DRAFT_535761 [Suillus luteus UH-Slu-Lm8-n1]|uniref:Uncharacterized protein n=1 Tax=Suillus luteus UH-Slu-Lm8-n1 TaxID=930992 RepID=A0A0D0BH44_9AGAM|nr:hypothetical protein CY34DRAFT_535761 [Suillus luteus UH-Slu-Lm8-n1]
MYRIIRTRLALLRSTSDLLWYTSQLKHLPTCSHCHQLNTVSWLCQILKIQLELMGLSTLSRISY